MCSWTCMFTESTETEQNKEGKRQTRPKDVVSSKEKWGKLLIVLLQQICKSGSPVFIQASAARWKHFHRHIIYEPNNLKTEFLKVPSGSNLGPHPSLLSLVFSMMTKQTAVTQRQSQTWIRVHLNTLQTDLVLLHLSPLSLYILPAVSRSNYTHTQTHFDYLTNTPFNKYSKYSLSWPKGTCHDTWMSCN